MTRKESLSMLLEMQFKKYICDLLLVSSVVEEPEEMKGRWLSHILVPCTTSCHPDPDTRTHTRTLICWKAKYKARDTDVSQNKVDDPG